MAGYDRDWLGMLVVGGSTVYVRPCEEDEPEAKPALGQNRRPLRACGAADLLANIHMSSWVDADNTQLMVLDRKTDTLKPTIMLERLASDIARLKPRLVVLDTAADLFGGSEIHRGHSRQFITAVRRMDGGWGQPY